MSGGEETFQSDLQRAIEASKASSHSSTSNEKTNGVSQPQAIQAPASQFLAERAKLERERLERQKRIRGEQFNSRAVEDDDMDMDSPPTKRHAPAASSSAPINSATPSGRVIPQGGQPLFWGGEIRQTGNRWAVPSKDKRPVFRLTDILGVVSWPQSLSDSSTYLHVQTSELSFVILSSYCTNLEWIYSLIPDTVPTILIDQEKGHDANTVKFLAPNRVRTVPALRGGRGAMHIKVAFHSLDTSSNLIFVSSSW